MSLVQLPYSNQGKEHLTRPSICILSFATAKSTAPSFELHPCKEPLWMHNYPPISVESTLISWWLQKSALSPLLGEGMAGTKLPPDSSLSLQKVSRDILLPVVLCRGITAWKCLLPTHWLEICLPVNFISSIGLPGSQPVDFLGRMHGSSVCSGPCWGRGGEHV